MKLNNVRRILKEDLDRSGDLPPWIDQLLIPLNNFIDNVTNCLRNGVSLGDNINGKIVTVNVDHGVVQNVSPSPLKDKVIGVIPLSTGVEVLDKYGFTITSTGQIAITYFFVNTAAKAVSCKLYLIVG